MAVELIKRGVKLPYDHVGDEIRVDGRKMYLGECTNRAARPGWWFVCDEWGQNVVAVPSRPTDNQLEAGVSGQKHNNLWNV